MTADEAMKFVAYIGIPGAILALLGFAAWKAAPTVKAWIEKTAAWGRKMAETQAATNAELAASNAKMADSYEKLGEVADVLKVFIEHSTRVDISKIKGQLILAKMHLLHIQPEKREEALSYFRELERMCDEANRH